MKKLISLLAAFVFALTLLPTNSQAASLPQLEAVNIVSVGDDFGMHSTSKTTIPYLYGDVYVTVFERGYPSSYSENLTVNGSRIGGNNLKVVKQEPLTDFTGLIYGYRKTFEIPESYFSNPGYNSLHFQAKNDFGQTFTSTHNFQIKIM
ncbi:hypothetical protein [Bacillus manliponensis]|uniref:hypothetical protein n=1 Tax=Bacillus manliponensis TaxID=574376 RepID=UPI00068C680D|nr:hypothetical protein [Bacillus manliponensis]